MVKGWTLVINGKRIKPGQKVKTFRGETVKYLGVSKARDIDGPSSGKVLVDDGWGCREHEYYPGVLNGELVQE